MLKYLGFFSWFFLVFVIEDIYLIDGEGCSCGFIVECSIFLYVDNLLCFLLLLGFN